MRALSFLLLFTLCTANVSYSQQPAGQSADAATARDAFIRNLLSRMTLEEKVGQMNQYNGFWDVTGPVPEGGDAERKYEDLRSGRGGSMLNIPNTSDTRGPGKTPTWEAGLVWPGSAVSRGTICPTR